MKKILIKGKWMILFLVLALLSGCGAAPAPAAQSTDIRATTAAAPDVKNSENGNSNVIPERTNENSENKSTDKQYSDTYFENYGVNPFKAVKEEPVSTFALDVDTASYTKVRNYINNGSLPPKDAVRVEEFVNYFKRQYPIPTRDTFSIYTEVAPSVFEKDYHLIEIGLQGKTIEASNMKNSALTFIIDVSGSMNMDNRLGLVKKSLKLLVDQMGKNDTIGIVVYGTKGRNLLDHTSGSNKKLIMEAIDNLKPEGSTNAAEGLMLGYDMAYRNFMKDGNNRVVICTDGVANDGITKAEEILKMIEDYRLKGITLSACGFGMDNYNDVFLEKLADKGDGNYYYIDTLDQAKKIFVEEIASTLQVIAKDAKAQVEFNNDCVESYRLIGYEDRKLNEKDFRNDSVDAGEVGAGHAVTALYEVKFKNVMYDNIGIVRLRYKDPQTNAVSEVSKTIKSSEVKSDFFDATPRFRFLTMVAEVAEILRGSEWVSNNSLQNVYELLKRDVKNLEMTKEDSEFVDLVGKAVSLKSQR